jgi:NDP-sugar pyrophosphorylase family protein
MANIIPMAGVGSRFSKNGYRLPKPLIPVSGKPLILQVIKSLPASDKWIFIVRKEHIDEYAIDTLIKTEIPAAIIVPVEETTEGQASTCVLALPYVGEDEPLFIAACDNSFLYDAKKFESLKNDPSVDAVVWTFTDHPSLSEKPEAWGWVNLAEDNRTITGMSVKVPISSTPRNDHAVVATFYFRKASDFKIAYELMVSENYRTNGEFYIDSMPVFYNKLGKKSVMFDVELYVGWGKPEDLYLYDEWEYKVRMNRGSKAPEFELWKKFISSL